MNNTIKKLFAMTLAVIMVLSMLPLSTFAAESDPHLLKYYDHKNIGREFGEEYYDEAAGISSDRFSGQNLAPTANGLDVRTSTTAYLGSLPAESIKYDGVYRDYEIALDIPADVAGSFIYFTDSWTFRAESLIDGIKALAGRNDVTLVMTMKVTGSAASADFCVASMKLVESCDAYQVGSSCSKCGKDMPVNTSAHALYTYEYDRIGREFGSEVADADAVKGYADRFSGENLAPTANGLSVCTNTTSGLGTLPAESIKYDGVYHDYVITLDIPADVAGSFVYFTNSWVFRAEYLVDGVKALAGKTVPLVMTMKVTGSASSATFDVARMQLMDPTPCEAYASADGTYCTKCGKSLLDETLPEELRLVNAAHLKRYDTDDFPPKDNTEKIIDDADSVMGKAWFHDLKLSDGLEFGWEGVAISGTTQNVQIKVIPYSEINQDPGYHLYKITYKVPQNITSAGKQTYLDWRCCNKTLVKDLMACAGKTVDIYISMKVTDVYTRASDNAILGNVYVDQMFLVDSCTNYYGNDSVCDVCGAADKTLPEELRPVNVAHLKRYDTDDFPPKDTAEKIVDDSDSVLGKAWFYRLRIGDGLELGWQNVGIAGQTTNVQIKMIPFADMKLDSGYQFYKVTYDVPANITAAGLQTYFDWRCCNKTIVKDLMAYSGKTVDIYFSMKATNYAEGLADVYIDQMILVTDCEDSWNAGEITTAPTYEAAGVMTYTCTKCGATKTESIAKLERGELTLAQRYATNKLIQFNTNLPATTPLASFLASDNGCVINQSGDQNVGWIGMANADGTVVLTFNFNNEFTYGQSYTLAAGSIFTFTDGSSYVLDKTYTLYWNGSAWTEEEPAKLMDMDYRWGAGKVIQYNTNLPVEAMGADFLADNKVLQSGDQNVGWISMANADGTVVLTFNFNNAFTYGQSYTLAKNTEFTFNGVTYVLTEGITLYWNGSAWTEEEPAKLMDMVIRGGTNKYIQYNTNLPVEAMGADFLADGNVLQSGDQNVGWISMANADGTVVLTFNFNNAFTYGQSYTLAANTAFTFNGVTYVLTEGITLYWNGSAWTAEEPVGVAQINGIGYESLAAAFAAAADGDTITLLADIELNTTVVNTKNVTLDLNGKTITGTDRNIEGNFYLINNNKGNLTIDDSVGGGKITLIAENERNWSASSVVVANNLGTVTVKGGTFEHLGGTSMAYAIDNLTNGANTEATLNIQGGVIDSTYFAVRQFANHGTNNLNITGGDIGYVWMQSPNAEANIANISITGGYADGLCLSSANAVVNLSAAAASVGEIYGTMPAGKELVENNGVYGLEEIVFAMIGETKYETLAAAFEAAVDGDTIVVMKDMSLDASISNTKKVTLDLNGKTITGTDNTDKNFGLINNTGVLTVKDSIGGGKITVTSTVNSGWGRYSAVISNNPGGTLIVESGTLENLGGTDMAYAIDSLTNGNIGDVSVTINGGTIKSTYRAIRQFLNSDSKQNVLTINGGTVTGANKAVFFQDPSTKANNGTLTIGDNAVVEGGVYLFVTEGSTEWPVEVSISTNAVPADEVTSKNVPEGYQIVTDNGNIGVTEYVERPTATVTEIDKNDLTFALNFVADEATEKQLETYGNWYADFVLKINKDVTFNADGGADGYLAGQYDDWSSNWVYVPFKDVTLAANTELKIMAYAAELMGKPGLKYTYKEVYDVVKDFDCGVFLNHEFLLANPDIEVTLELRMYNPADESESYVIGETYVFTLDVPEMPTATVTEIEKDDLTFALNFLADEATAEQLAYYGDWYADFVLKTNKDVTFNANGNADGYLAGQYDAWSSNWVYVPFENVTLAADSELKIMEYAAGLLGKPGLKYTYKEVYEVVKNFDCGVFFTDEYLLANPDLEVTLELRMYNPGNENENYVIGETYVFKIEVPERPTATVTEIEKDDLTFALNFLADEATKKQLAYYGGWYADFVLSVNKDVTFNANGNADGYLAGQYDAWSNNWVYVPFEDVTLAANSELKIMAYAAELMDEPGLKYTYKEIYEFVKNFDCGVYFSDEYLLANPDLEVTLELRMYNPADESESYVIGRTYVYRNPIVAQNVQTGKVYNDVNKALNDALEGETVILLKTVDGYKSVTVFENITFDLNGYSLTTKYFSSFGDTIDSSDANSSVLVCSHVLMEEANSQLPVKTAEGYKFYRVYRNSSSSVNGIQSGFNGGKFAFVPNFEAAGLNDLLAGKDASGVKVMVNITWTSEDGMTRTQLCEYSDELVTDFINSYNASTGRFGKQLFLTLNGEYSDLSFQAYITSETGVAIYGAILEK